MNRTFRSNLLFAHSRGATCAAVIAVWLGALGLAVAQQFTDVTNQAGITFVHQFEGDSPLGSISVRDLRPGAAAADYDNDGWIDLFIPNGAGFPNHLYHNQGDGTFAEVAASAGVTMTADEGVAGLFFDYDGDGWLDLYVAVAAPHTLPRPESTQARLFRNLRDGTFKDVTDGSGITAYPYRALEDQPFSVPGSVAAADLDMDDDLDLYVCYWADADRLLRNNGDGTFTDVAQDAGIYDDASDSWQVVFDDFDRNGLPDIFVMTDFDDNRLYLNQGELKFVEQARSAGLHLDFNEMGAALGDYDRDGDLDIYISNIERPFGGDPLTRWNTLMRNDSSAGEIAYTDVAPALGVHVAGYAWGVTFLDYDNDGWLDIAATNGSPFNSEPGYHRDVAKLWRNLGFAEGDPATFEDTSVAAGFNDTRSGRTVIGFDYDRDGDVDLFVTNYDDRRSPDAGKPILYRNDGGNSRNWIGVRPRMESNNTHAIGTRVLVTVGDGKQLRPITAGTSFLGQEPAEAIVGIGDAERVDEIRVIWPDGLQQAMLNERANNMIEVVRPTELGDPIALQVFGPSVVAEAGVSQFSALADYGHGVLIDVTADVAWTSSPVDISAFLVPGSLVAGEVSEDTVVSVQAIFSGIETTVEVVITNAPPSEGGPPVLTISQPTSEFTHATFDATVILGGRIEGGVEPVTITWSSNRGPSGIAAGAPEWLTGPIALELGVNNITVTATCPEGEVDTAQIKITRVRTTDQQSEDDPMGPADPAIGNSPRTCGAMGFLNLVLLAVSAVPLRRFGRAVKVGS